MHTPFPYLLISCALLACTPTPSITITSGQMSEGQECFSIQTPTATYWYQKTAGGFSNLFDAAGTDWIQFHKSDTAQYPQSAAADYRGLPNLVFSTEDGGCGHPGFGKMTSEQIGENQIRSTSRSGKWQWTWTFYPEFAALEIERTDPEHAYWFLYEGPVAGSFSPETHYWGTDQGGPLNTQPDLVKGPETYGHWQTVYVGDRHYDKTLFVHQVEPDTLQDLFTYMGNSMAGNDSEDGMLVLGLGRAKGAMPLMQRKHRFLVGFYAGKVTDEADHNRLLVYVRQLIEKAGW